MSGNVGWSMRPLLSRSVGGSVDGPPARRQLALVLPGLCAEAAASVARRIRTRIADEAIELPGESLSVDCTIGVACTRGHREEDSLSLLTAADDARLRAKPLTRVASGTLPAQRHSSRPQPALRVSRGDPS